MVVSFILAAMVIPGLLCIIQDVKNEWRYYNNY